MNEDITQGLEVTMREARRELLYVYLKHNELSVKYMLPPDGAENSC